LRKLGFKNTDNHLFANHSWYFKNALVRANYEDLSRGIYRTDTFLIRFLSNLLVKGNFTLKNREMHINNDTVNDTVKPQIDTVNDTVFSIIKKENKITAHQLSQQLNISLSTVKREIKELRNSGKIERIGSDKTGYWSIIE
jgi:Fic family protein